MITEIIKYKKSNYCIFAAMKTRIIALVFAFLSVLSLNAQEMDFGLNLGAANYLGEIGGSSGEARGFLLDMRFDQTSFAVGGFFRYSFSNSLAAKLSVNFARIEGADSLSDNPNRIARNLSFRTDMIEATLTGEYAFLVLNDLSRRSKSRVDFRAHAFTGAGVLFYYPYAQANNEWFYLRPLQTEGVENAYNEMTIVVPLGIGASFTFNNKIRLGMEIGYRFSFTDYLDDVSTDYAYDPRSPEDDVELPFEESKIFANRSDEAYARGNPDLPDRGFFRRGSIRGNPDTNDGYLLAQFNISMVVGGGNSFYKPRYNSLIKRRRRRTKF